eukprot:scaffold1034_cov418-Prasinococcus_capsulatus_cf.AAC.24
MAHRIYSLHDAAPRVSHATARIACENVGLLPGHYIETNSIGGSQSGRLRLPISRDHSRNKGVVCVAPSPPGRRNDPNLPVQPHRRCTGFRQQHVRHTPLVSQTSPRHASCIMGALERACRKPKYAGCWYLLHMSHFCDSVAIATTGLSMGRFALAQPP